jgi:hypothetical protein
MESIGKKNGSKRSLRTYYSVDNACPTDVLSIRLIEWLQNPLLDPMSDTGDVASWTYRSNVVGASTPSTSNN